MAQSQNQPDLDCKVLSIVWYKVLPARFGGQKAIAKFNEHLASFAPLICLCSENNKPEDVPYRLENNLPRTKLQFINPFVWWKIYRFAKKNAVTHIILEFPYHGIAAIVCQKLLGVRVILNTHNIEYSRFKEMGKRWWKLLFFYERWVAQQCDLVLFKTFSDKKLATKAFGLAQKRTAIIPYGVDVSALRNSEARALIQQRHSINPREKILLFAGTLDYGPNAQAVLNVVQKLIPLLNHFDLAYKVLICGRNRYPAFDYLNRIQNPSIIFAGEVNDIENYFSAADVFINPVMTGGGIQTKIMDALSYHLNVVAFESRTREISETGTKLWSVPDCNWTAFAEAVFKATFSCTETPPAFFDTYNWRTIAAKAYQKICLA
jgi:glycosyltransferase involved in cell wall biosynthesis